jgi:SPP1 gp7 family putative phage head morphogenesis protein
LALLCKEAGLIQSLPLEAADRAAEIARDALASGERAEDLAKRITALGNVSESRARVIARTEVSKAGTALTKARAEDIGSSGYIWRTARDGATRPSHRAMEGKFVKWDEPQLLDGMTGHAGEFPNCRCYPEPVIPREGGGVYKPALPTQGSEKNAGGRTPLSQWEREEARPAIIPAITPAITPAIAGGTPGTESSFMPSKSFTEYLRDNDGDHFSAAREFYRGELAGKSFAGDFGASGIRKVQVELGNFKKIKHRMKANPVKAELVAFIPEIIETGQSVGRLEAPNHAKYSAFHTLFKEVETGGKRIKAMLDVGELDDGMYAYNLNHEGAPTWEAKKRYLRETEKRGLLKGGKGTKIPGFDSDFGKRVKAPSRIKPGMLEDNLQDSGGEVNLFILEVIDIATGRRLPEYEDVEAA